MCVKVLLSLAGSGQGTMSPESLPRFLNEVTVLLRGFACHGQASKKVATMRPAKFDVGNSHMWEGSKPTREMCVVSAAILDILRDKWTLYGRQRWPKMHTLMVPLVEGHERGIE